MLMFCTCYVFMLKKLFKLNNHSSLTKVKHCYPELHRNQVSLILSGECIALNISGRTEFQSLRDRGH